MNNYVSSNFAKLKLLRVTKVAIFAGLLVNYGTLSIHDYLNTFNLKSLWNINLSYLARLTNSNPTMLNAIVPWIGFDLVLKTSGFVCQS